MSTSASNDVVNNAAKFGVQQGEGELNRIHQSNSNKAESVPVSVTAVSALAAANKEKSRLVKEILAQSKALCFSSAKTQRDWLEIEKLTYYNGYAADDLLLEQMRSTSLKNTNRYLERQNILLHYEVLRLRQRILSFGVSVPPMPTTSSTNSAPVGHEENHRQQLEPEPGPSQIYTPNFDYYFRSNAHQREESSTDESDVPWHSAVWESRTSGSR